MTTACAICLAVDLDAARVRARLLPCGHEFCYGCARRWTDEETNACPLCKVPATTLERIDRIALAPRARDADAPTAEELLCMESIDDCVVCGSGERPGLILLCDGCGRGMHTYCLSPPRRSVPPGQWFCPDCRSAEGVCRVCGAEAHDSLAVAGCACAHCNGEEASGEEEEGDEEEASGEEEGDEGDWPSEEESEEDWPSEEEEEDDAPSEEEEEEEGDGPSEEEEEEEKHQSPAPRKRRRIVCDSPDT